jgi:hypothetical protein
MLALTSKLMDNLSKFSNLLDGKMSFSGKDKLAKICPGIESISIAEQFKQQPKGKL